MAEFFSAFIAAGINGFVEVANDDTKIGLANAFLMTQKLPTIDKKNLPSSLSKLVAKFLSIVDVKFNVKKYEKLIVELVKAFDKDFMKWSKFNAMPEEEQVTFKSLEVSLGY